MAAPYPGRSFSMAGFLGFVELTRYMAEYPDLPVHEAIRSLQDARAGTAGFDFGTAATLVHELDRTLSWSPDKAGLRLFISEWARLANPAWLCQAPYGHMRVRAALNEDEIQCFREAGLFEDMPDDDVVSWWDSLAAFVRGTAEAERMERARQAERLSLEHERKRLADIGIDREPKWMSLGDNFLGYDILSYDRVEGRIVNRLIEVKSTLSDTFIVTRGEWKNAAGAAAQTVFHVWRFPGRDLTELSALDMEGHMPEDRGKGLWNDVSVTL